MPPEDNVPPVGWASLGSVAAYLQVETKKRPAGGVEYEKYLIYLVAEEGLEPPTRGL